MSSTLRAMGGRSPIQITKTKSRELAKKIRPFARRTGSSTGVTKIMSTAIQEQSENIT